MLIVLRIVDVGVGYARVDFGVGDARVDFGVGVDFGEPIGEGGYQVPDLTVEPFGAVVFRLGWLVGGGSHDFR